MWSLEQLQSLCSLEDEATHGGWQSWESGKWCHICEDIKNLWIILYVKSDSLIYFLVTWVNNKSPFLLNQLSLDFCCLNQKHLNRYTESWAHIFNHYIILYCFKTVGWIREFKSKHVRARRDLRDHFCQSSPQSSPPYSLLPASPVCTCALLMKKSRS